MKWIQRFRQITICKSVLIYNCFSINTLKNVDSYHFTTVTTANITLMCSPQCICEQTCKAHTESKVWDCSKRSLLHFDINATELYALQCEMSKWVEHSKHPSYGLYPFIRHLTCLLKIGTGMLNLNPGWK
jgi:hypothetical protein